MRPIKAVRIRGYLYREKLPTKVVKILLDATPSQLVGYGVIAGPQSEKYAFKVK